jgi:predicted metal-binding protein
MGKKAAAKKPPAGLTKRQLVEMALKHGALAAKAISPSHVPTSQWVRWKCRFGCGGYGSSLVCPPHTPEPHQTRAMLDEFRTGVLFESPPGQAKKIAADLERELFLSGYYKAFGLGCGPCGLCDSCTFDEGCRHPRRARPSMEAVGIDVFATARGHGFTINVVRTRKDPQHYFGLVLVE